MKLLGRLRSVAPVVAGVLLGLALLAPAATAAKLSSDAKQCGGDVNAIQADIRLAAAKDIWTVLPALGISPELETDSRPAHVIIFKGDFDTSALAFAGEVPKLVSGVVCVVQGDGTPILYGNVSLDGSAFTN